jgi:hypothetical protein
MSAMARGYSHAEPETDTTVAMRMIRESLERNRKRFEPKPYGTDSWKNAARETVSKHPELCARVMDAIGSWSSSEPELAALQLVWGRN